MASTTGRPAGELALPLDTSFETPRMDLAQVPADGHVIPSGGLFDMVPSGFDAILQVGNDGYVAPAPDGLPADIFGSAPLSMGVFGASPMSFETTAADIFGASPSAGSPLQSGSDAIRFLADRGGVSFMMRTPQDVARALRTELGEATFRRVEFLFSGDSVSRARVDSLRERVAERAGHRYTNLDSLQAVVRDVLREDGINIADPKSSSLGRDVLDGVLMVQLLPNEVPLYRSTEHVGQSGENGSSWWGVGEGGLAVASNYATSGRVLMQTTVGDLRQSGVVRTDTMAVTGNALELYHFTAPDGTFTTFQYETVQPLRFEFSLEGLSTERRQQVDAALGGRDPHSLTLGDQKELVYGLARNHGWSTMDLENVFGNQLLLSVGYGQTYVLDLPSFE